MVNQNNVNPNLFALLKEEVNEIVRRNPDQYKPYVHRTSLLFNRKVSEKQKECFLKIKSTLENLGYNLRYHINLDDCFILGNPFRPREIPMYEIVITKLEPRRVLFLKLKPREYYIARIRLVGLFLGEGKSILEPRTREGAMLAIPLAKAGFPVELQGYVESDTEEFMRLKTEEYGG